MRLRAPSVTSGGMTWTATLGDVTFAVAGAPTTVGLAPLGLALLVLVATGLVGRGLGKPALGLWILVGAAMASGLAVALPFALWAAQGGSAAETLGSALFHGALLREVAAAVGAVGVVGVSAAIWAAAPPGEGAPAARAAFASLALAGAGLGIAHACWVLALGPFPVPEAEVPAFVHVGQRVEVPVTDPQGHDGGWTLAPVTLAPNAPGAATVPMRAERFGASVTRAAAYEAGEDRLDPLWPLAVGRQWRFVQSTSWHSHYLWFVSAPAEVEGPQLTLTVASERVERGLHTLVVTLEEDGATEGQEPPRWEVFGWNGETVWIDEDGAPARFLGHEGEAPAEDGSVSCSVQPLAEWSCRCLPTAPGGPLSLPGPARCEVDRGGVGSALLSGFVAIVTVGLVLEDPNRHHTLELISSGEAGSSQGSDVDN